MGWYTPSNCPMCGVKLTGTIQNCPNCKNPIWQNDHYVSSSSPGSIGKQVDLGFDEKHGALMVVLDRISPNPEMQKIDIINTNHYEEKIPIKNYTLATGPIIAAVGPHIPRGRYIIRQGMYRQAVINIIPGELGVLFWDKKQ